MGMEWRPTTDGVTTEARGASATAPRWLKLVRSGNTFTGSESTNGTTWTQVSSQSVTMTSSVYVGLFVTSANPGTLGTDTLDNVSMTQP